MLVVPLIKNLAEFVDIKPLAPDDMSDVRYVHATAFRLQANAHLSPAEIQSFTDHVYSTQYGEKLETENLLIAWLGEELIGTGGWSPVIGNATTARIRSIFVRPLFTGLGIGSRLVNEAETRAVQAGFTEFTLRASVNSVGFFQSLGFEIRSHGVRNLDAEQGLPVRFMRKSQPKDTAKSNPPATKDTAPSAEF